MIIIGAGGHGLSLAYHLKEKGISEVTIIESHRVGYGSSGRNASRYRYHFYNKDNVRFALDGINYLKRIKNKLKYNPFIYTTGYLWLLDERNKELFKSLDSMWKSFGIGGKFMDCSNFGFLKREGECYFAPQDGAFHHDYI
ncbi:FAD-binding oxidoreductase, partial [Acidianus sp. RZ1]